MKVELSHCANPDVQFGYWIDMKRPKKKLVDIKSFADASLLCRGYINKYKLGAGNWSGGGIFNDKNEKIANVSYNGKVWDVLFPWTPESKPLYNPYQERRS